MTQVEEPGLAGKRLVEDALPIGPISAASRNEKIGNAHAHPRKIHLWWARRPLAAARAAVYATLVPADQSGRDPAQLAEFFDSLCRWGGPESVISQARAEVLRANGGVPPKVVDLFAGGGAIPLEAARLGCEVTANELNPVAHLIERMMLEYPQAYPGLADDIRRWGKTWIDRVWDQLADLYPVAPDTARSDLDVLFGGSIDGRTPLAYLWTRTVRCPNPALAEHSVDLVRQTWLGKKKDHMVALRPIVDRQALKVTYQVAEAPTADALGFDPAAGSSRGRATCRICGAAVTADYVKAEGRVGRIGVAPLAAVVLNHSGRGRQYLGPGSYPLPDENECARRLAELPVDAPNEMLVANYNQAVIVPLYGLTRFRDLFTPRQLLTLCTLASGVRETYDQMLAGGIDQPRAVAVATALALAVDRAADYGSSLCHWHVPGEKADNTFARQALPMVWDFAEINLFGGSSGDIRKYIDELADTIEGLATTKPTLCIRGSATSLPLADQTRVKTPLSLTRRTTTTSLMLTYPISSMSGSSARSDSCTPMTWVVS